MTQMGVVNIYGNYLWPSKIIFFGKMKMNYIINDDIIENTFRLLVRDRKSLEDTLRRFSHLLTKNPVQNPKELGPGYLLA